MRHIVRFLFACTLVGAFSALPAEAQFFEDDFSTNPFGDIAQEVPRRWCERYHHVHWDDNPESSTFNAMLGVDGTCCGGWTLCGGCWGFDQLFPGTTGGSCGEPIDDPLICPDPNSSAADGCRHLLISEHNYPGETRRAIVAFGLPVPLSADCIPTCAGCPVESVRVAAVAHPHCDASIEARVVREASNYRLQIVATTTPRVGYPECASSFSETYDSPSTFSLLNTPTTRYRLNVQTSPSPTFPLTKLFVRATLVDRVSAATIASLDINDVTRPAWYDVEGRRFAFGGVFPTDFTATAPTFDDFFGLPAEPEASPTAGPSPTPTPTQTPTPSPSPSPTPPASTCGNGALDSPEICDGNDLAGHTCESVGFVGGALACASDCSGLDTRECDLPATPPVDPQVTAPPIDTSVATEFGSNVEFLYLGGDRVQYGVVEGVIADRRAAVVRGKILDVEGNGLPLVEIRVLRHPELGATLSRADGRFDMVVNGGGPLTLTYTKPGHLTVHRRVSVPWLDYVTAQDAVMIEKDSEATEVTLSQLNGIVVHESSLVPDDDGDGPAGARQAKLLFFPGTTATMNTPTGSENIDHLTVRATEYTVGERGLERMPAELPPNTAYTYAVEFSVDEAEQNDASSVTFSGDPVVFYVENFLDIPATNHEAGVDVPVTVPVGYYDREAGVWVPAESGRIVTIVSTSGTPTKADVDTDGNGSADNEGISDAEREALVGPQLYGLRALPLSLWRVELSHFSPWDCNWPFGPPPDSGACSCPPPEPARGDLPGDPGLSCASVIGCEPQTLGESVEIVGTPYRLHYQSDRVLGRAAARTLRIPLSGDNPPALTNLRQIDLEISVAGKTYFPEPVLIDPLNPVLPSDPFVFTWDGRDAYERLVQGRFPVTVRIGYTYAAVYGRADRFGDNPTAAITGSRARNEITFWSEFPSTLENWDARAVGLGGWTLDVHHMYDPDSGVLLLGNGQWRMAESMTRVVETVAGGGISFADGMPAKEVNVNQPRTVALGADGSLYIGEPSRVLQIRPDGLIYRIAGVGSGNAFNGEGPALATTLRMDGVSDLAIGPDGSIYAAVAHHQRVRRIYRQDGQFWMETFAGSGPCCDGEFQGDGGPATQARLNQPTSIAVAPDGVVYIGDMGNRRIRRVGTDGVITTVAGNGLLGFSPDGTLATDAYLGSFSSPTSIALDREGILHFVERHASLDNALLRRIRRDGTIETVAGVPGLQENPVEGGSALQEGLAIPESVSIAEDGSLLISEGTLSVTIPHIVRRLSPRGSITTVAGVTGERGFGGDAGPARLATFNNTTGVRAGRGDTFYVPDSANDRVRIVRGGLSRDSIGNIIVASENGREIYVFDPTGRHRSTRDAFTNAEILTFAYDDKGRLESIIDAFDNATVIAHPALGTFPPLGPGTITAPGGQDTHFVLDDQNNGYLKSIENPGAEIHYFSYTGDGLLLGRTDPLGHSYEYSYDADGLGRLVRDADPEVLAVDPDGSFKSLARDDSSIFGYTVAVTTASGHVASYGVENLPDGRVLREELDAAALPETVSVAIDGRRVHTTREGVEIQRMFGPDPRFGMVAPVVTRMDITTPGSLHAVVTESRTATPSDPAQPLVGWERIVTVNGRSSSRTYDGATRTITDQSPAGRRRRALLDPKGKILSTEVEGLWPVSFSYDGFGRVTMIRQGPSNGDPPQRIYTLGYDTVHRDRVTELHDPLLQTVLLGDFTGADAPQTVTLPDLETIGLNYDANGNVTSITPPSRPSHSLAYSDVDLIELYTPPQVTPPIVDRQTSTLRHLDRRLESQVRPGGEVLQLEYDPVNGRLTEVALPPGEGTLTYGYDPDTGQLAMITGTIEGANRPTIAFGYDGWLNTSAKWACENPVPSCPSGTVSGEVTNTYDNNFLPLTQRINGGSEVTFAYDTDGLLTGVGALTVTRDTDPSHGHGHILGTALGGVTDVRTYNQFGELETYTASYGGAPIFEATYLSRDNLGRVTQSVERIAQGTPEVCDYVYDTRGRLDVVTRDGQVADYDYDSNGNRTVAPNLMSSATYDEQDRLLDYGGITYGYSDDGEVTSRTESGQTTVFEYDALGSLRSVQRSGEPIIEYVNDGLGRRVGKKVGGVLTKGWLYDDRLRIVAELDGTNAVVSRFVYGTRINVPDYGVIQGQVYRFITDQLGSVRLVVDAASGAIAQRIDYDEFGNPVLVTGSWELHPFGFAGGLADADTGLVRFGRRDYDASVGRWTARDPSLFRGSKTNLYEYVSSDPINFFDPFGATQCDVDVAIDVCKRANPGWDYPADIQADLHDPPDENGWQDTGLYIYIPLIWEDISLNDKYLSSLDDADANELLDSLLHELIHANDPWYKNLNDLFDRDHPDVYRKAAEEAKRLLEQYLAERAARCGGQ